MSAEATAASVSTGYQQSSGFYSGPALTSLDETWATPPKFFAELDKEFGFTLDAAALQASTLVANNWYGPDHSDSTRHDALVRDWTVDNGNGAIWLNPPYGRQIDVWMRKAALEADAGATVVCLVPARTDTRWMWDCCFDRKAEHRFIRGRLKFGLGTGSAPFPSVLVIMRPSDTGGLVAGVGQQSLFLTPAAKPSLPKPHQRIASHSDDVRTGFAA